jgi:hypothetical protein
LRPLGKKGKVWKEKRDELKVIHEAIGITTCELRYEGCAVDDYLGFAHAAKRRKLSKEDLGHVILACNFCHDKLEVMPPEQMKRIVDTICRERESTLTSL